MLSKIFAPLLEVACRRPHRVPSRASAIAPWMVAFTCLASAAHGDWLVTRDGHEIETQGPWRVEGSRVLFRSLGGTLHSIELSEVDLELSEELTEALRHQPRLVYPRPELRRVEDADGERPIRVERRPAVASRPRLRRDEVVAEAPSAPDVYVPDRSPDGSGDRFETSVRLGGTSHDNFFQTADDEPPTGMTTGEAEALLTWRLAPGSRHRAFLHATHTELEELQGTTALRLGLHLDDRRHALHLWSRLQRGHKVQDLEDDAPEPVERLGFFAGYRLRPNRSWSVELVGDLVQERPETSSRDAETLGLAAAVRYRGLELFAPELGVLWARSEGDRASRDYEERGLFLKLRLQPFRLLVLEIRGRQRERAYGIRDPDASNFGRQDTRRDWSVGAHFLVVDDVVLNLTYEMDERESSRARRSYSAHRFSLGLSFTFGGGGAGAEGGEPSRRGDPEVAAAEVPVVAPSAPAAGSAPPVEPEAVPGRPASPTSGGASESVAVAGGAPARPAPSSRPPVARQGSPRAAAPSGGPPKAVGRRFGGVEVVTRDRRRTVIEIRGTSLAVHSSFSLGAPDRYVVDFPGVEVPRTFTVPVESALVRRVRIGQFREPPPGIVRVVFDLQGPFEPRLERIPAGVRVTFEGP